MPPTTTTTPTSVLPPLAVRNEIGAKLEDLIAALAAHPLMQRREKHKTVLHTWDFTNRTRYILSELDNIEAGRPVQYPAQIPDYRRPRNGARDPSKAREHMTDVFTRSMTVKMMVDADEGMPMLAMMGLMPIDFGADVQDKATAVMVALEAFE
ncbi:hypothetical protein QBC39DRAFT_381700 [Podospora conica]|nr:hypothetical protein QBC39DRAFT_381700 [Schizothecium conicum]